MVKRRSAWVLGGIAALLACGGVVVALRTSSPGPLRGEADAGGPWWSTNRGVAGRPAAVDVGPGHTAPLASTLGQIRSRILGHPSFAGTSPSGDWCVRDGRLSPCQGLRQRFEYYLLALGLAPARDIRALVEDEARRDQGDRLAAEIMSIWDRYLALRSHPVRSPFDQNDRSTWMPVFEERQALRRQMMGMAWAEAFFAEEERYFRDYHARLDAGESPSADDPGAPVPQILPGEDPDAVRADRVARYGQAGADRLAVADAAWADWERRLDAAKAEKARLAGAAQLSDTQRAQAMQAYVRMHFKPDEWKRVKALLDF